MGKYVVNENIKYGKKGDVIELDDAKAESYLKSGLIGKSSAPLKSNVVENKPEQIPVEVEKAYPSQSADKKVKSKGKK